MQRSLPPRERVPVTAQHEPGVPASHVKRAQANIGYELLVVEDVPVTEPPSIQEQRLLPEIDPAGNAIGTWPRREVWATASRPGSAGRLAEPERVLQTYFRNSGRSSHLSAPGLLMLPAVKT